MRNCCCFVPLWCLPCQNCPQVTSTLSFESCLREYGRESRACPAWKICRKWLCALEGEINHLFFTAALQGGPLLPGKKQSVLRPWLFLIFFSSGHEFSFAQFSARINRVMVRQVKVLFSLVYSGNAAKYKVFVGSQLCGRSLNLYPSTKGRCTPL